MSQQIIHESNKTADECHHSTTTEIDEEAIVPFEPYLLIEGILEKPRSRRDFFLARPFGKSKDKWVKRYFRLYCKDPETYTLVQYTDDTPKSKVRRVLEMNRVSRVSTNMALKTGAKNWIFSIDFSARPGQTPKDSKLHLAADSEGEMNRWVKELCMAGNLKRQGCDEPSITCSPTSSISVNESPFLEKVDDRSFNSQFVDSNDSFVETVISERPFPAEESSSTTVKGYTLLKHCSSGVDSRSRVSYEKRLNSEENSPSSQPYIHLKNCASSQPSPASTLKPAHQRNRSFGSSSGSSSQFSYSSDIDSTNIELSSKSPIDSLAPPPRPPKTKTRLCLLSSSEREGSVDASQNDSLLLNQPLPPPDLAEIGIDDSGWSGETIRPLGDDEKPSDAVTVSHALVYPPDNLIPPKIDRSCKPPRKDNLSSRDDVRQLPPRRRRSSPPPIPPLSKPVPSAKPRTSVPVIPRTNPLNRIQRDHYRFGDAYTIDNSLSQEVTQRPRATVYLEPVQNSTNPSLDGSESPTTQAACELAQTNSLVEYALIDETSTQAVIHANMLQNELRAQRSQW